MRRFQWISLSTLLVLAGWTLACGEGNPVAPPGTILTITASPSRISLNGQAQIIVEGRRPDGNRLPEGTEIRFSTNLGNLTPLIAEIDSAGRATAVLRGDGRSGTATVTVTTGTGAEGATEATVDVLIGESPETAAQLLISANPDDIPIESTSTITVIAREPDGTPVGQGETIILTTTLGTLNPARPVTDSDGVATSTLLAGEQAGEAVVAAILGASDQASTTVTIRDAAAEISLTATPASVTQNGGSIRLDALVTNAQGEGFRGARVTFLVNRGTLQQPGVVPTDSDGIATNTLVLDDNDLDDLAPGDTFPVTARTVTGAGDPITSTVNIRVTGGGGGG